MKKKLIALTLVTILAILAFGSATIAYFTDTATANANTFTVGSVKIELQQNNVENSSDIVPGRKIDLQPTVKNTGKSAAYVRIRVLIPVGLFDVLDKTSCWNTDALNSPVPTVTSNAVSYYQVNNTLVTENNAFIVTRNEKQYYSFDFTYANSLGATETTVSCWDYICISTSADNADLSGITTFDVLVEADAIQAEGFDSAVDAFVAFDSQRSANP